MGSDALGVVLDWAVGHGLRLEGCAPAYVDEGWRGIEATRGIPRDALVMAVPSRLLMSATGSARRDRELVRVARRHGGLDDANMLAVHLMRERDKGKASFWHKYIQALPTTYTNLHQFNEENILELQDR